MWEELLALYREALLQEASAHQLQRQVAAVSRPLAAAQRLLPQLLLVALGPRALARRRPLREEPRPLGASAPPRLPWERVPGGSGQPLVRLPVALELLPLLVVGSERRPVQGGLGLLAVLGRRLLRAQADLGLAGSAPRLPLLPADLALVLPIVGLGQRPPRIQVALGQQTRVGLGLRLQWAVHHPVGLARVVLEQLLRQVVVEVLAALAALVLAALRLQQRVGLARRALALQRLLLGVGVLEKRVLGCPQAGLSGNTARRMGQNSRLLITSAFRQT